MNELLRTLPVVFMAGLLFFRINNFASSSSSISCGDSSNNSNETAATAADIGHTRLGPASLYAQLVGLVLESSVLMLNLLCVPWHPNAVVLVFGMI